MSRFRWNTPKIIETLLDVRPNAPIIVPNHAAAGGCSRMVICLIEPFDGFKPIGEQECLQVQGWTLDQEEILDNPDDGDVDRVEIFGDYYFEAERESENPEIQALRKQIASALETQGAIIGTDDEAWDPDEERWVF